MRTGVALLVGAVVFAGCGSPEVAPPRPEDSASGASPVAPGKPAGASASPAPSGNGPRPIPERTSSVVGLNLPTVGVATDRLEELRLLPDGSLAAPKKPALAGWYADGPVPGELGPAIIAGHVDSKTGPAIFARLEQLRPGDKLTVTVAEAGSKPRKVRFTVDKLVHASKDTFPTKQVYGPTPDAQLRLITCSGSYDRVAGSYLDNTVVFATAQQPGP